MYYSKNKAYEKGFFKHRHCRRYATVSPLSSGSGRKARYAKKNTYQITL